MKPSIKKLPLTVKTPQGELTPRRIVNKVLKTSPRGYLQALRKALYVLNKDNSRRPQNVYEKIRNDIIKNLRRHFKVPVTANLIKSEKLVLIGNQTKLSIANKFSLVRRFIPKKVTASNIEAVQKRLNKLEIAEDLTKEEQEELDKLQKLMVEYDKKEHKEESSLETASSIFSHRHYNWLAHFAAHHLNDEQTHHLANRLQEENPNFKPTRFHNTVHKHKANKK